MARRKREASLRIYKEGGDYWMEYGTELTDQLWVSPRSKWVAGFFHPTGSTGTMIVLTDRHGTVLKFRSCEITAGGVSDEGTVGVVEVTGGPLYNVRFYFPDGTSSKGKRANHLALASEIKFTKDGKTCVIETMDGKTSQVDVNSLPRGQVKNSVVATPKAGCRRALVFLFFILLLGILGSAILR